MGRKDMYREEIPGQKDTSETYTDFAMCDYHYDDFNSEEGLDKPFNMKDNVYSKYKYN
jgi:hypothetical protein